MRSGMSATLWGAGLLLAIGGSFCAADTSDQQVDPATRRGYCTLFYAQPIAQEFVPTCTWQASIDLYLKNLNDSAPAGTVSARVLLVDGDDDLDADDVVVAQTDPGTPGLAPGQAGWFTLQFSPKAPLTPGVTYAIEFLADTPRWAIAFSIDDAYPAGDRYRDGWRMPDGDYVFRTTCAAVTFTPGDLNCDGVVNVFDIDPFVLALSNPDAYESEYPYCDAMLGDVNGDGTVNVFDIDPFVRVLTGGAGS